MPLANARGAESLSVLFVSPYPICPPVHGGGVFMYQTALELTRLCDLHLLILLDYAWQREPHQELERKVASVEYLVRTEGTEKQFGSILPHAVREFASQEFEWRLHREMYLREIDVVQLEYTALSQYGGDYRQLGVRAVRARHLFSIHREGLGEYARFFGHGQGILRVFAGAAV